ncbi:acyltransferase [Acidisphaera sp. S103]|uniref:acyltransferase family protein n=1 Tax=Acidisphaera sp. S103 TaxID=1747223 RepID=UPI00131D11E3|nr:acyltransferase [Acidisphaera sp. S103]
MEQKTNQNYMYGVDMIRFIAAVLVGLFHLTWLIKSTSLVAWYGWVGVQVFFVISGLVIAQSAQHATPRKFAWSRFMRLYPAAWICAVINLSALIYLYGASASLPKMFIRSLALFPVGPFLASAYWTLPIELTFYGLILVLLLFKSFQYIERVAVVLCVMSATYIIAFSLHVAGIVHLPILEFNYADWKSLSLLRHGVYFACGIFLWLWSEGRLSRLGRVACLVGFMTGPLEITCRSAEMVALLPVRTSLSVVWPIPVLIWYVACGLIGAAICRRREIIRYIPARILNVVRMAGLATYPLYLLHELVGKAIRDLLVGYGVSYLLSALSALSVAAFVAFGVARFGEPLLRSIIIGLFTAMGLRRGDRLGAITKTTSCQKGGSATASNSRPNEVDAMG